MVKVAVAGGTSTHEVTPGVDWAQEDYNNPKEWEETLRGVHTLLSFVVIQDDPRSMAQKNLIDAAVRAGVKRFAPSEWATSVIQPPILRAKEETRRYLEEQNRQQTVLEYTLFQPGLFINYLTTPFKSAAHLHQTELPFDFNNRRAIVPENYDQIYVTLTKVQDLAQVVARAISFEGKWPVVGGVKGTDISLKQLISVGEKVRGGQPFQIETVKPRDLESGAWSASWTPRFSHPAIPPELVSDTLSKTVVSGILLGISGGCFKASDEWNQLLHDYEFTTAEDFLTEAWTGKP
ncbi:hypothetical protein Asppvi_008445 [Aspergillus pseudoviridinutans]|uniref:NmrA-like domain-containing protein n=1 Tax=Aspergillus pseudoviridinutans TaxID=1517512 RepID=A0A9P3BI95_9EURO|nr:uncharacterized protein Asppvi_008445 [Aspergillus pseudoviridinutans]GIJ89503.1 hypothetical protein Asppvi_008445 [Aspergillus pseudoviridinutans]